MKPLSPASHMPVPASRPITSLILATRGFTFQTTRRICNPLVRTLEHDKIMGRKELAPSQTRHTSGTLHTGPIDQKAVPRMAVTKLVPLRLCPLNTHATNLGFRRPNEAPIFGTVFLLRKRLGTGAMPGWSWNYSLARSPSARLSPQRTEH